MDMVSIHAVWKVRECSVEMACVFVGVYGEAIALSLLSHNDKAGVWNGCRDHRPGFKGQPQSPERFEVARDQRDQGLIRFV